ncbi:hypothetical protein DXG01_002039 [Tephrocybe rancida]|nr:hypothetical protein DXG01_002039 [Tephrocybe rancida]
MSSIPDSSESKTLRLRLVTLLSLYDLLPPSFDKAAFLDFNSPPPMSATSIDKDSTLQSLLAIAQRLRTHEMNLSLSGLTGGQLQEIPCSGKTPQNEVILTKVDFDWHRKGPNNASLEPDHSKNEWSSTL